MFDVVPCTFVFHHLPDDNLQKQCVREIHRVLKPGGKMLLVDIPSHHRDDAHHHNSSSSSNRRRVHHFQGGCCGSCDGKESNDDEDEDDGLFVDVVVSR